MVRFIFVLHWKVVKTSISYVKLGIYLSTGSHKKRKKKRLERNSKMYRNCMHSVMFHTLNINVNHTFYSVGWQICDKCRDFYLYLSNRNKSEMNEVLIKFKTYRQNLSFVLKTGKISHDLRSSMYWKMKPKINKCREETEKRCLIPATRVYALR